MMIDIKDLKKVNDDIIICDKYSINFEILKQIVEQDLHFNIKLTSPDIIIRVKTITINDLECSLDLLNEFIIINGKENKVKGTRRKAHDYLEGFDPTASKRLPIDVDLVPGAVIGNMDEKEISKATINHTYGSIWGDSQSKGLYDVITQKIKLKE